MPDAFVSYARQDAVRVEPLVELLEANGCSVWWDRHITPGSNFERTIEDALANATCVVIALTEHAATSDWVRAESAVGQQHNKVIPVLLDDVQIPLSLRALQVADLRDWPNGSELEVQKLIAAVSTQSQRSPRAFVGRDDAMHTLQKGLDAALDGNGGLVMISGEPGIGKTRCAEEFARLAEDHGALVLWGRCYEQPGAPPFWPWVQILREYADANSDDELRLSMGRSSDVIATLIPELGQRLDLALASPLVMEMGDQRFHLYDALTRLLERAAATVPLLLIIDDLHWTDPSSLSILEYLAKELRRLRCLIVCAYRDVEVTRKSPLLATLGELTRTGHIERLRLSGLTAAETGELTATISGMRVPQSVIEAIYHQTDGNPLFVREVALVLADEGRHAGASAIAVDVPDGIREAIGRRLDQLSEICNELIATASVIGRDFELRIVAQIQRMNIGDCIREMDAAVRAGLVQQQSPSMSYRFTHAVIRETLYEEIPTLERLHLHRRIAIALANTFGDNLDPVLAQLAHHYGEASALGDLDTAVDFALRAATRAEQMYAYEEAFRLYDSALDMLVANGRDDDARAAQVYFGKGRLAKKMIHIAEAVGSLSHGIGLARRLGDADLFARHIHLLIHLTSFAPQPHAVALVQEALRMLPADARIQRAAMLANLAFALRSTGDGHAVETTAAEAVAMARQIGDPSLRVNVLWLAIMGLRGDAAGTLALRLQYGREAMPLCDAVEDQYYVTECYYWHLLNLIEDGDIESFEPLLDRFAERADAFNLARQQYQAGLLGIALCLLRGDWSDAERRIERVFEQGHKLVSVNGHTAAEGIYGAQMFVLNRELGRLRTMAPLVRRMIEQGATRLWAPGLMAMCCEVGLLDQARTTFEALAAHDFSQVARDDMWLTCMVFCAETCVRLGDSQRAATLYDLVLPFASQTANYPPSICFGSVGFYLGILAHTMGRRDLARDHFERAVEKNRAMGAWPALARTEMRLAQLLLSSDAENERESGRRLIAEAEQLARRFKMMGLVAEIGEILNDNASQLPDGLTPREVDVLKLLAIGRSNKDISKVLNISLSTVATHVRSILTKAGCANRTEAAAYARRQELA